MLVESETDWIAYRGMNPDFVRRVMKLKEQAKVDAEKSARQAAKSQIEERRRKSKEAIHCLRREVAAQREIDRQRRKESIAARKAEASEAANAAKFDEERQAMLERKRSRAVFEWLILVAEERFGVSRVELLGQGRNRYVVFARQFVMYWMRRRTVLSMPRIGRLMGNRDHTTIISGCKSYVLKRAQMGRYLRPVR